MTIRLTDLNVARTSPDVTMVLAVDRNKGHEGKAGLLMGSLGRCGLLIMLLTIRVRSRLDSALANFVISAF
jgi:hypothetical protein